MPLYQISVPNKPQVQDNYDLTDNIILASTDINDYEKKLDEIKAKGQYLRKISTNSLIKFFDTFTREFIMTADPKIQTQLATHGISFLLTFLKRNNLESMLKENFHGKLTIMDEQIYVKGLNKNLIAQPRGVITHWLAGNVPILGMISLIQGILTRNVNVVKLSRENGLVLPLLVSLMVQVEAEVDGIKISGRDIFSGCLFLYCEKDDIQGQQSLSLNSDIRVAWGGRAAVENVMSLTRRYGTEDVIFGPKYSFAVVGRNSINMNKISDFMYRLALDASVFDQQGCNSPHTVFVEQGGTLEGEPFAQHLANAMGELLKRIPRNQISSDEAYSVVNIRSEYFFTGKVFSSEGTEWTVIYSEEEGLADACYSRIVFVRPVKNLDQVLNYIKPKQHQTIGLSIATEQKEEFVKKAAARGIERITEIGKMSVYDHPWDGTFPMDRFVRWVSIF